MCNCDWNYTCSRCAGTPLDDRYPNDEPQPGPFERELAKYEWGREIIARTLGSGHAD